MTPLISIVMATYNGERFLREQLESLLSQTHADLELVICDDASADGTYALIEALAAKDKRIRPHRNEKTLGLVSNFMKAVTLARGECVAYSDQDDVWEPKKIETLLRLLNSNSRNMLAYSDLEIFDEAAERPRGSFWEGSKIAPFAGELGERALLKNISPGCSMLFRRPVADMISTCFRDPVFMASNRAAVLDETPFMHDHLAQALAAGLGRLVYTRQKLVRYRQHASNTIGAFYRARDSREEFSRFLWARLEALKPHRAKLKMIDWKRIAAFAELYSKAGRGAMPEYLPYFLFLRNDSLKDVLFGTADCFLPTIYQKARRHAKKA